jgi:hypothetical protein
MNIISFNIPETNKTNVNTVENQKKDFIQKTNNIFVLNENVEPVNVRIHNDRPTICFATMCKNEEHCIKETLESVYKYIDYWVVSDTGSTDQTCKIITDFFKEKNIPGELHKDEWKGFDHNKTMLFNYCYKKTDYILHLDADDLLVGDFKFTNEDAGKIQYYFWATRGNNGSNRYKVLMMFHNHYHWRFCGVAHTIIICLDNKDNLGSGDLTHKNCYLHSRDTGNRSADPEKYYKDALKLQEQFFNTLVDDPYHLNSRSVFYTAQSYHDSGKYEQSAQWYSLYIKLSNTWIEEVFESYLKLGKIFEIIDNKNKSKISYYYENAIQIFPDRAEPYVYLGNYLNHQRSFTEAYNLLKKATTISLKNAKEKYKLFINEKAYGKYINDELSVACYWLEKYIEGKEFLSIIIDDPDFNIHKERLNTNMDFMNKGIEKTVINI